MDVDDSGPSSPSGGGDDDGLTSKVLGVVEKMFARCYAERTWTHALGIALEARNLDRVKEILDKCGDDLKEKLDTLKYGLESCTTVVVNRKFRNEALTVIAAHFRGMPDSNSDYSSLVRCEHLLGNSSSVADMISSLIKLGGDSALLALQICFDLVDTGDQHFVSAVTSLLPRSEESPSLTKALAILEGGFAGELELAFLYKESDSDPLIIANLKKSLEEKGKVSSLLHSMSLHAHAFLNAGTTNDQFVRNNLEYLKKANNWAKFSATSGLGCIHQGHVGEAMTLLEPYLPSEGGAIAANGGYAEGGALLALGLIHGKPNCAAERRKATVQYLREQLRANQANEVVCHGAAMGIGLAGLGCRSSEIFNELREVLYTDSAVAGEASGLAMGMIQVRRGGGRPGAKTSASDASSAPEIFFLLKRCRKNNYLPPHSLLLAARERRRRRRVRHRDARLRQGYHPREDHPWPRPRHRLHALQARERGRRHHRAAPQGPRPGAQVRGNVDRGSRLRRHGQQQGHKETPARRHQRR